MTRIRYTHLFAAAVAVITIFTAARPSFAQLTFTDPPCPTVTVINNSAVCNALVDLVTKPAGVWPAFTLAPGTSAVLTVPAGGVGVKGLNDVSGNLLPFLPPDQATFDCGGPNSWWISGALLAPVKPCRFYVCADPDACTITLN